MILLWHNEKYECEYAIRGKDSVRLYDSSFKMILSIDNISSEEWNNFSFQSGDWSESTAIPSEKEILQSDIDYLSMINESLESDNEFLRADLDYCLMLLEE